MLGLIILPMLLGAAFLFDDDGSGSEDPIGQPNPEEPVQPDPEENGDLIQFDRDDTRYSGSDAAVEVRGTNLDNMIRAGGGDDTVVAEGGDDRVDEDAGDDTLYGRDGDDVVFGGTGHDRIFLAWVMTFRAGPQKMDHRICSVMTSFAVVLVMIGF
jgi:hypothetical protein